jgi:hypothetical protein
MSKEIHFDHAEDGTVFVHELRRSFRNLRCVQRRFRGCDVVLVPVVRTSVNRVRS